MINSSFNIDQLLKIRRATSASKKSKRILSQHLLKMEDKISQANKMNSENQKRELLKLMNEEGLKRRNVLKSGISSYANPKWAAPSACENWLLCLLREDNEEIFIVELEIYLLMNPERKNELKVFEDIGSIIILVLAPIGFLFFNWWAALIIIFIGFTVYGWNYRYD